MRKRYDRNFKVSGQKDARGQLYIFAGVPLDESIEVTPVDKDLSVPGFLVDDCYLVKRESGTCVLHLEAELRWHSGIPRDMARYIQALDLKFELPVESVLVLLTPVGAPDPVPSVHEIRRGDGFNAQIHFAVRKLWEIEATEVLELGRPSLWPWIALMKSTNREMRQCGKLVADDSGLAAQFYTLGKLNPRYTEEELLGLLGRRAMLLKDSILEQSPYLQSFMNKARVQGIEKGLVEGLEKGLEKGLEQGLEQGRQNLLDVLLKLVDLRFHGVAVPARVRRADLRKLKTLVDLLFAAPDKDAARQILSGK